jgi:hypothetical protein
MQNKELKFKKKKAEPKKSTGRDGGKSNIEKDKKTLTEKKKKISSSGTVEFQS